MGNEKACTKHNNNDGNANNILFLLHVKHKNEIVFDWKMKFDYELITENGKHARATNALNEDSSCVNNIFLTIALGLLQ